MELQTGAKIVTNAGTQSTNISGLQSQKESEVFG